MEAFSFSYRPLSSLGNNNFPMIESNYVNLYTHTRVVLIITRDAAAIPRFVRQ